MQHGNHYFFPLRKTNFDRRLKISRLHLKILKSCNPKVKEEENVKVANVNQQNAAAAFFSPTKNLTTGRWRVRSKIAVLRF